MVRKRELDCFIQARITSKRFPKKVLKKIKENTILEIIFKRLSLSKNIRKIVFLIPKNKKNLPLLKYLIKKKYKYICGSEKNVLSRYYTAAKKYKSNYILRVTSDCPFVDSQLIDQLFKKFIKKNINYASNTNPPSFPDGFDIEIFDFQSLKKTFENTNNKSDLEHVTPFLIRNKSFKRFNLKHMKDYSKHKLSIDTQEDYIRVKKIFNFFNNILIDYKNVLKKLNY